MYKQYKQKNPKVEAVNEGKEKNTCKEGNLKKNPTANNKTKSVEMREHSIFVKSKF